MKCFRFGSEENCVISEYFIAFSKKITLPVFTGISRLEKKTASST